MNRRSFLHRAALIAGASIAPTGFASSTAASPAASATESGAPASSRRNRVLRVAHLTDLHLQSDAPGLDQPQEGVISALRHAQSQPDRPDLILFGGDTIMDSLKTSKDEAVALWSLWQKTVAAEVRLPHYYALGNHDMWGWAVHDRPAIERDPDYGKGLALRLLGLDRAYYAFDRAGWHFIVLDSLQIDYGAALGYIARLDDEQFAWLAGELARTAPTTPICVLSHVPIIAACPIVDQHIAESGTWMIPGALTHRDAIRIKNLFGRHPNVKLCLSGHVHLADDLTYRGVRYCCNGAVSGNWWKGDYEEYGPAYALVDFYDDGSAESQLVYYRRQT